MTPDAINQIIADLRIAPKRVADNLRIDIWLSGEHWVIACDSLLEAYRFATLGRKAGASAWCICDTTVVSVRRPLDTWSEGPGYWEVFADQVRRGIIKVPRRPRRLAGLGA